MMADYSHYFVYPIAPACGGVLAGLLLHLNKYARKGMDEYTEPPSN